MRMIKKKIKVGQAVTSFYFDGSFKDLPNIAGSTRIIAVTDTNVWEAHRKKFARIETIVIPAGEQHKTQQTVDSIILQLTEKKSRQKHLASWGRGRCGNRYNRFRSSYLPARHSGWLCAYHYSCIGRCGYWREEWRGCGLI